MEHRRGRAARHVAVGFRHRRDPFGRSRLGELGWYDDGVAQVSFWTGPNDSPIVTIDPGILVWERLRLSDGTLARLVTSIAH